jgi:transposase InsO family protein
MIMFDQAERQNYCKRHELPAAGVAYIETLFTSDPSRAVGSRMGNVCGKFASSKMGCTLQFESRTIEFPFLLWAESSDDVLAMLDQPPQIKLECHTTNGRRASFFHTPDFALLTQRGPKFVETKPAVKLRELEQKTPWRYRRGDDGRWHCPPGEIAAKELGFGYQVVSDEDLNPQMTANVQFLLDYLSKDHPALPEPTKVRIFEAVRKCFGVTVAELTAPEHGFKPQDVHVLLARRELFFDWQGPPLTQPDRVRVFWDANFANAHHHASVQPARAQIPTPHFLRLAVGAEFVWKERSYKVLNLDPDRVVVVSGKDSVPIPREVFEQYIRAREIVGLDEGEAPKLHPEVQRLLGEASKEDLAVANRRYAIINNEISRDQITESDRTIDRWREHFRIAEARYGNGYVGLLRNFRSCGNQRPRFPERLVKLMEKVVEEHFMTKKAKSAKRAHEQLHLECERIGLPTPSRKTWLKFIRKHPKHAVILAREGRRAAYQHESDRPGHHRVDGPVATWPWKKAHLDHTKIDMVTIDKETGKTIDRAWLSILWDEAVSRILAIHLTYDEPSYRSCLAILRECVLRHGRLPESITVDNGPEFRSVYFETVTALFRISIFKRPRGEPRYGAGCERTFGVLNQEFFHALAGNTKIMKNVRQVTKSVNPRNLAVWSLEELDEMLCIYAYEIYEQRELPSLHMTPAQAYAQGIATAGERANRMITYDQDFLILTMPSTRSGRAKVQVGLGIKVNRIWYWHDDMAEPAIEGSSVEIRFDPSDMGHVYARLNGRWIECESEYHYVFHGRSEREISFASREIRALNGQYDQERSVYGKRLAEFLEQAENQECLMEQRIRDLAHRRVQEAHEQRSRGVAAVATGSSAPRQNASETVDSKIIQIPPAKNNTKIEDSPLQVFAEF